MFFANFSKPIFYRYVTIKEYQENIFLSHISIIQQLLSVASFSFVFFDAVYNFIK